MDSALILPDDVSDRLEQHALAIDSARASGSALMFDICKHLQAAHDELANHKNGTFCRWVEQRCGFSKRTAFRYLGIAEAFGDLNCAKLAQYAPTETLEFLARDTTPEAAVDAAVELADKGERITLSRAKKLVEELTVDGTAEVTDEPEDGEDDSDQSDNGVQTDLDKLNDQIGKLIDRINGMVARNAMQHNAQSKALVAHMETAKKLAKSMWRSWRNQ